MTDNSSSGTPLDSASRESTPTNAGQGPEYTHDPVQTVASRIYTAAPHANDVPPVTPRDIFSKTPAKNKGDYIWDIPGCPCGIYRYLNDRNKGPCKAACIGGVGKWYDYCDPCKVQILPSCAHYRPVSPGRSPPPNAHPHQRTNALAPVATHENRKLGAGLGCRHLLRGKAQTRSLAPRLVVPGLAPRLLGRRQIINRLPSPPDVLKSHTGGGGPFFHCLVVSVQILLYGIGKAGGKGMGTRH